MLKVLRSGRSISREDFCYLLLWGYKDEKMRNCSFVLFGLVALLVVVNGVIKDDHKMVLEWKAPKDLQKMYPYYLSGFDNDGTPICVVEFGQWNLMATLSKGPDSQQAKDFKNYIVAMWTWCYETPVIYDTGTDDFTLLLDLEGFDLRQLLHSRSVRKMSEVARQLILANRSKTKRIKQIQLVNAKPIFKTFFTKSIRPVLGKLGEKAVVYGENKKEWLPVVLKNTRSSQLPEFLGGDKNWKPVVVKG